jgi:acetate kinase
MFLKPCLLVLQPFGIEISDPKNKAAVGVAAEIQSSASKIKVLVIPTDEELGIAQQTLEVLQKAY